ncbi:UDP-N-acetylglucosamine 1-carboxyvinyltransferase [SAR86 cluster bacterium]|mgnify:FL=1|nr:UDP-N-acetylglucosamine 1-carboxyvinyltransferase [SAR86 cluster bacterium]|tara:strand:+ start:1001 stop:2263 length:1263 start_codon:yes stop_codon:yes gene_type:complete
MDKLLIEGGFQLNGSVTASGAKNSALPILASSILLKDKLTLSNIPHLNDITTMLEILSSMGAYMTFNENMDIEVNTSLINNLKARYELVKTMRASILVLGPLLARFHEAEVALPGGCAIGSRPVNLHLDCMRKLGANIDTSNGYIKASAKGGLTGANIEFSQVTVTGTENAIMAATLAKGQTKITNAAKEPEVTDLIKCLNKMGAKIQGEDTDKLIIDGVRELKPTNFSVMPDRIEIATYLTATTMTGGEITVKAVNPNTIDKVLQKLELAGAKISKDKDSISLKMKKLPSAVNISTAPYPSFPTDMQAQFIAMNSIAKGQSEVIENVFENRFMHVQELIRMGGKIELKGNSAMIDGNLNGLTSAPVMATDLRASASLVLAGLVAKGITKVDRIYHIDRGYERIEEKLKLLGAKIDRISE